MAAGIRDITQRLDIPLIIDEVQTGFGRTGTLFAHGIAGIVPDAIVMSKAVVAQRHPCIGDVRGRGLMIGVEIVNPNAPPDRLGHFPPDGKLARAIKLACLDERLIVETGGRYGAVIRFLPPLVISEDEIRQVVARFESAVEKCFSSQDGGN